VIAPARLHRQALPIEAAGPVPAESEPPIEAAGPVPAKSFGLKRPISVPAESFGLKRPVSVPAESERSEQPYKARFAAPHGVHTPRGEK